MVDPGAGAAVAVGTGALVGILLDEAWQYHKTKS